MKVWFKERSEGKISVCGGTFNFRAEPLYKPKKG
jgi:hypothetical protein